MPMEFKSSKQRWPAGARTTAISFADNVLVSLPHS
jgi:hypothetical protein